MSFVRFIASLFVVTVFCCCTSLAATEPIEIHEALVIGRASGADCGDTLMECVTIVADGETACSRYAVAPPATASICVSFSSSVLVIGRFPFRFRILDVPMMRNEVDQA